MSPIIDDWYNWTNREDALWLSQTEPGAYVEHLVESTLDTRGGALRFMIGRREVEASLGRYTGRETIWELPVANLDNPDGHTPKPGDIIQNIPQDSSTPINYTILDAQLKSWSSRYHCITIALEIVEELSTIAELHRPRLAQDAAGHQIYQNYDVIFSGLRCRIQPDQSTATIMFGRKTSPNSYFGYFAQQLDGVRAKDQLVVPNGTEPIVYTITGYKNAERLGQLFTLMLEQVP